MLQSKSNALNERYVPEERRLIDRWLRDHKFSEKGSDDFADLMIDLHPRLGQFGLHHILNVCHKQYGANWCYVDTPFRGDITARKKDDRARNKEGYHQVYFLLRVEPLKQFRVAS